MTNRRGFLGLAGAGIASGILAAETSDADLVVINAKVYTVDSRAPQAEAFAVKSGRFTAVGSNAEIKALAGKSTQTFDARRMTIVPGFIDCHNHAPGNVLLYEVVVGNPYVVEFVTIASIVDKLRARARETPPGTWVEGYFFDDTKLKDNRPLNVHDLDQVSKDHPVVVHHRGGHTGFYNSKALEMADINRNTPNPPGGTFDRDAEGNLTGRVTDRAMGALNRVGKRQTFTEARRAQRDRDGLAYISKQFVRYGVTSVHHEGGNLAALQEVRARGELLHRVSYEASGRVLEAMISGGIMTGFGDEWIRLGATSEHTVDGSFSERTMALSTPYPGVTPPYKGNLTESQDDLNAWIERVHRAGIQVNCHANGDVAIDMVMTAVERAQRLFPRADAPEDHPLHPDQRRTGAAHQGRGCGPGALHDLRLLQFRQVRVLRRGADGALHGVPQFPGCRSAGGGRLRLQSGTVRPAHGHSGHGDAHRLGWQNVGRQPAHYRGGGAPSEHDQRRVQLPRGGHQRLHNRGQTGGLRGAVRGSLPSGQGEGQRHSDCAHGGRGQDGLQRRLKLGLALV